MATIAQESMTIKEFPLGAAIVEEGVSSPKHMVVVLKGNVGVYKNYKSAGEAFIKVIGPGSFHCEQALFLNKTQTESLIALTNAVVLFVTRRNVKDFFCQYTDTAVSIVENICERLSKADESLNRQQVTALPKSNLFPENHGNYNLNLSNQNEQLVYCIKTTCPLCGHIFDGTGVMLSRLKREATDPDMRIRFKDAEPLYYDITTCPNCLFSADRQSFADAPKKFADDIRQKTGPYKLNTPVQIGRDRDTFTVFAGFYLALLCNPIVFPDYQLKDANLWLKLSRIYNDCGDSEMEKYAAEQALKNYKYTYLKIHVTDKQSMQICYLIGELNLKLGDLEAAKNSFYSVKANLTVTDVMKRQAENRIEAVRALAKAAEEQRKLEEESENADKNKGGKSENPLKKHLFGLSKR